MIRPLRQRHRRRVIALGVLLPIAFVVGIAVRRPVPTGQSLSAILASEPLHFENIVWDRSDLWSQHAIRTRLLSDTTDSKRFAVELSVVEDIVKPDLIVYWVPGNLKIEDTIPDTATLLGAFVQTKPTPLPLPGETATRSGVLVLYSLADHEVIAASKPFNAPRN